MAMFFKKGEFGYDGRGIIHKMLAILEAEGKPAFDETDSRISFLDHKTIGFQRVNKAIAHRIRPDCMKGIHFCVDHRRKLLSLG